MFSKLIIIGNLGRDPELRVTEKAEPVCSFSVATSTTKVGDQSDTTWYKVNVWGKQAEACSKFLKKGSKVLVEGRLQSDPSTGGPRLWQDKENKPSLKGGGWHANFEVFANQVEFLSGKSVDEVVEW